MDSREQHDQDWFERHVLTSLEDLKQGQKEMLETSIRMHGSNSAKIQKLVEATDNHAINDTKEFDSLKREIAALKPVRLIVYGAVGMILCTVFGALVAMVVNTRAAGH